MTAQFKFLHAADIHLDSALHGLERYEGAPVEEIRSATRRAFDNLVELAIDEAVAFVLLAGDLYDGDWRDYNTGLYFVRQMGRLQEAGIPVFIVAGNHDAASQITHHLRLPENVTLFSSRQPQRIVLEALDVAIYGQSFANRAVTEDLSQGYPQGDPQLFNIGLLHTCLDGKPGHEPYAPCTVDGLRSRGYQYWALGHVHQREVVSESPWIIFPGNIQGRHVRETGAKGCTLVTVETGEVTEVEHRDLDVLRWNRLQCEVGDLDSVDDIYQQVRQLLLDASDEADDRPLVVRLTLVGSTPAHAALHAERERWVQEYRALATGIGGAGIWLEKVEFKTSPPKNSTVLSSADDALGGLMQTIHSLELNEPMLARLNGELDELRKKLPTELQRENDADNPFQPEQLQLAMEDIRELLLTRLLSSGESG